MANTLTNLIPLIYEGLDVVSREMIGAIPAVSRDSNLERIALGQVVRSHVAPVVTASDIVPAVTPPNDGDQTFDYFDITIDNAKRVPIRWNGEEQRALASGPTYQAMLRDQWAQGFRALTNMIEKDILTKTIANASRAYGTPGTAPFGVAGDFTDFSNIAMILDDNGTPVGDRHMILNSSAMGNLRGRQSVLFKANESGTEELLRNGTVARVEGFDINYGTQSALFTKGTAASYVTGNNPVTGTGTYPIGSRLFNISTGSGNFKAGDAIQLAGDPNIYMVTRGNTAPNSTTQVQIGSPGLRVASSSGVGITTLNSYRPNIAMSKSASRLVTRAPSLPVDMAGNPRDMATDRTTVTDPVSGLSFEISEYLQYRQVQYEIAIVWGYNVTKPDNVAVLLG